jgi:hypothetical protein
MSETRRAEEQLHEIERLAAQLLATREDLERHSRSSFGHISRMTEHWHDPIVGSEIDRIAAEVMRQTQMAKQELEQLSATLWQTLAQAQELLAQREREEREHDWEHDAKRHHDNDERGDD